MLGAISDGETSVRGFLKSADCLATIDCFRKLGISIDERGNAGNSEILIRGQGLHGLKAPDTDLDCMNSGTTVRILSGILAGQPFDSRMTGDVSLSRRPMKRIIEPLSRMGCAISSENGSGTLPLRIHGGDLSGISYACPVASAQVKSCVLMAGLYADGTTSFTEPSLSRNHTELMLKAFGGNVKSVIRPDGTAEAILHPGCGLTGIRLNVPGDISSAAYFIAAGLLVPDSEIRLRNVGINETRSGILKAAALMGGSITFENIRQEGFEPTADLLIRSSELHGAEIGGALIPSLIDELPVIAVMAACAEGDTVITDAGELRVKESDRLSAIVRSLTLMGVCVEESADGMVIHGKKEPLKGALIQPDGDHRIAMAFSIAGLLSEGTTEISDTGCVRISYPEFYRDLDSLLKT